MPRAGWRQRRSTTVTMLLAAMLVVLFSASSAVAACAWVVWQQSTAASARGLDAEPVAAHPTKHECEQAISAILGSFAPTQTTAVDKEPSRGEVYVTHTSANGESWTHGFRYVCLPDTVDPRAQKSAGR